MKTMYMTTHTENAVHVDSDIGATVNRIHSGWRGFILNISDDGFPTIGAELELGVSVTVAEVSKVGLIAEGVTLGEGQVRTEV